jgi:hypothetical protein
MLRVGSLFVLIVALALAVDSIAARAADRPIELKSVAGLWKFADRAIWIKISADGSAFQCRIDSDGTVLSAHGRFNPPDHIAWDQYWNTETLEYAEGTLTIKGIPSYGTRLESFNPARSQAPMAPACVIAELHGS